MIFIASPYYDTAPPSQLEAAQALAQRAFEFRASYRGQDMRKRRDAAKRGRGK